MISYQTARDNKTASPQIRNAWHLAQHAADCGAWHSSDGRLWYRSTRTGLTEISPSSRFGLAARKGILLRNFRRRYAWETALQTQHIPGTPRF